MPKKFIIPDFQAKLPLSGAGRRRGAGLLIERRLFALAGFFLVFAVALYLVFIIQSVSHVVARESLARENARLSASVSRLERDYLAQTGLITESYARSLGFVTPRARVFLETTSSLSLRDAR